MRPLLMCFAAASLGFPATPASSQAVKITAGRIVPFEGLGATSKEAAARAKGANEIAMYATALFGSPGAIGDVPAGGFNFHYATLHMLFSAAALPQVRGTDVAAAGNLQRLNGHVTIVPLDSAMQPIEDQAAVEVLATFPDTILLAPPSSPDSGTSQAGRAAFGAVARTLTSEFEAAEIARKSVGKMMVSFKGLFHRPSARVQVAYVSELREFGWMWYEHPGAVIEGTHRTSAALEVAHNVRYLRVQLRVIADWRSHGAWERDMELILEVPRPITGGPAND